MVSWPLFATGNDAAAHAADGEPEVPPDAAGPAAGLAVDFGEQAAEAATARTAAEAARAVRVRDTGCLCCENGVWTDGVWRAVL